MIKFLNCKIALSKRVFEPRIETEYWVKRALKELKSAKRSITVLDVFAGTGCIGIAILKACPELCRRVDFVDISKEATAEIKTNLKLNKIENDRYKIYKSNLFEKLKGKKYDFIFANPPYVALNRIKEVQKEVLKKEPKAALFAGKKGMLWIKRFIPQARKHLRENGRIFMEFDPKQMAEIERLLKKTEFHFKFKRDQFKKFRWLIAW